MHINETSADEKYERLNNYSDLYPYDTKLTMILNYIPLHGLFRIFEKKHILNLLHTYRRIENNMRASPNFAEK